MIGNEPESGRPVKPEGCRVARRYGLRDRSRFLQALDRAIHALRRPPG